MRAQQCRSSTNENTDNYFQLKEQTITWSTNFSSSFYLMAEKTSVEGQEEIFLFAFEDLVNGIGGALGLFLGWSILSIGKTEIM